MHFTPSARLVAKSKAAEDCAHSKTLARSRQRTMWPAGFGVRAALCRLPSGEAGVKCIARVIAFRLVWLLLIVVTFAGCTSRSKARAQAQAAFVAGQQQALIMAQQARTASVTVVGHVRNPVIPWTEDLTVAKAIVAAGYSGLADPREILIRRSGQEIRIESRQLLSGEDVPLQTGDVVEIRE